MRGDQMAFGRIWVRPPRQRRVQRLGRLCGVL